MKNLHTQPKAKFFDNEIQHIQDVESHSISAISYTSTYMK